jgi:hypothetical protein
LLADAIKASKSKVPEAVVITNESGESLHSIPLAALLPPPQPSEVRQFRLADQRHRRPKTNGPSLRRKAETMLDPAALGGGSPAERTSIWPNKNRSRQRLFWIVG